MALSITGTSAAGLLAQLNENDHFLQITALQTLNTIVHDFWFQIASSIASLEAFYEDENFSHRKLAALVASKVFYYLGELDDALTYALGAENMFYVDGKDVEDKDYINTLLSRCVDRYIELRKEKTSTGEVKPIDSRLESIIQQKFKDCYHSGAFDQAIGIALDARRLDKIVEIIHECQNSKEVIEYAMKVTQKLVGNRAFREKVLAFLVEKAEALSNPDYVSVAQCHAFLGNANRVAAVLSDLLQGNWSKNEELIAYQISYDLFENQMDAFLLKVEIELLDILGVPRKTMNQILAGKKPTYGVEGSEPNGRDIAKEPEPDDYPELLATNQLIKAGKMDAIKRVLTIISGNSSIQLYLDFLHRFNHSDIQVLKDIKAKIESRNSVCHGGLVFANAIMHCGTTIDTFLRENLDWLSRATNWAKFNATAGLGVIHRGHLKEGKGLMSPYLPGDNRQRSPFSEGGALFALGLIYANHGQDIRQFLVDSLKASQSDATQHGACLGVGLSALGTNDEEILEELKSYLYLDNAIAGEAAGIAMGLVACGSASEKTSELLAYAHETQHEKIIRGVSLGLALIMYGREEGADTLIEQMTRDQDPIIRYGGMQAIGMAYRGTSNNAAIQKLLYFAVSDVSDDVRRAAVMNLGFLLIGNPEQCPKLVALLSESYNPHARYGAAMAIGIACSCTGSSEAINILNPLLRDTVDFVRQGAYIATAMVLMLQANIQGKTFRKTLATVVGDKHEEVMSRLGAIMATGILEAGGRNSIIGLQSRSGLYKRTSCIGVMIFTQYWFWYPLSYFLSLSLQPSAIIALNEELEVPALEMVAQGIPSEWAYPPPVKQGDNSKVSKVPQAVLSTTRKVEAKRGEKERKKLAAEKAQKLVENIIGTSEGGKGWISEAAEKNIESPDVTMTEGDTQVESGLNSAPLASSSKLEKAEESADEALKNKKDGKEESETGTKDDESEEPVETITLQNPTRCSPEHSASVHFIKNGRYQPLDRTVPPFGIIIVRDTQPGEKVILSGQESKEEDGDKEKEDEKMDAEDDDGDLLPPMPFKVGQQPQ